MRNRKHYKILHLDQIFFCRTSAIGSCSTMARFGGILAPWVAVYLPDQVSFYLPV
jgi:hypothetical protein